MFAFELGREYKLSIAEIYALFPEMEIIYFDEKILLLNNINKDYLINILNNFGGTIKIIEIENQIFPLISECNSIFQKFKTEKIFQYFQSFFQDKKNNFAINFYGKIFLNQKDFILKAKKYFQKNNFSTRFVNQDFQNIRSYQIIKEKLIKTKSDFNLIFSDKNIYFGKTIFVQDIDSYSKRDFGKQRDMQTGMLPPKLAQIMINLGISKNGFIRTEAIYKKNFLNMQFSVLDSIYDPFCGLGTILLEAILAGNKEIYGSDINSKMIEKTIKNIEFIKNNYKNNLKSYEIIKFDAKEIANSPILKNHKINSIITEGYLGKIFGEKNIDLEKIKTVRLQLQEIFEGFFYGLQKIKYTGILVISFPFWEIKGKYYYFEEIYEILKKYCEIKDLLPKQIKSSKTGSLLYKRSNQTVGREIFKLKIKQIIKT